MYYEARTHSEVKFENITQAVEAVKTGKVERSQVPTFPVAKHKVYLVDDGHINDTRFAEVAVLVEWEASIGIIQIESITGKYLTENMILQAAATPPIQSVAQLVFTPTGKEDAWFVCGCCGEDFKGNVKKQLEFDQDAGYGICDGCAKTWV